MRAASSDLTDSRRDAQARRSGARPPIEPHATTRNRDASHGKAQRRQCGLSPTGMKLKLSGRIPLTPFEPAKRMRPVMWNRAVAPCPRSDVLQGFHGRSSNKRVEGADYDAQHRDEFGRKETIRRNSPDRLPDTGIHSMGCLHSKSSAGTVITISLVLAAVLGGLGWMVLSKP